MHDQEKQLKELHALLTESLIDRIKHGEADPATLSVARQFLKDNGIDSVGAKSSAMPKLSEILPFPSEIAAIGGN